VAEKLGVPLENTYAFGDGVNDLCMIEAAGHGIAMGNAVDALKEKAEFITTPILEDGVYNGLKHYNLI
jgi:hydroxymethylpyrimidine pyrophosphatase-like HAD family hydrolase